MTQHGTQGIVTPVTADLVHGAYELESLTGIGTGAGENRVRIHRLPRWARQQVRDPQLDMVEAQPAGVRLSFDTESTFIEVKAAAFRARYAGAPERPHGVFDLVVNGKLSGQASLSSASMVTIDMVTGAREVSAGDVGSVVFTGLSRERKRVEIWLPHNESIELVSLVSDASLEPVAPTRPTWLHYGSSISQGSNARHPTDTWIAIAAAARGLDLVNLGLAGSAMLDPAVSRVMRDAPADVISVELGINIVNADAMRLRAFRPAVHGFLDMLRDGHPDAPLVVISPFFCPIHEHTPGPGAFDPEGLARGEMRFRAQGDPAQVAQGSLTLEVIRTELARIVTERRHEDPNLHYVDGLTLFGPEDERELPLPDALHPGPEAHRRMGERYAAELAKLGIPASS